MQIDPERFLQDGYVILKNVIPPDRLDELRASFETLVDRQQAIWARDPEDPRGMAYKVKQPRLAFQTLVDPATANTVEFCLHENTLGVSRQALRTPDVGLKQMFLMCNPATHYGPDLWHRDSQPTSQAPLAGLQADMLANGPGLVQWNIALYDDDVLWIVPGSHCRLNTAQENRELLEDRRAPLSNGMQVKLKAATASCTSTPSCTGPATTAPGSGASSISPTGRSAGSCIPTACASRGSLALSGTCRPKRRPRSSGSASWLNARMIGSSPSSARSWTRMRTHSATTWPCCIPVRPGAWSVWSCCRSWRPTSVRSSVRKSPVSRNLQRAAAVGELSFSISNIDALADRFTAAETELLERRYAPLVARLHTETEQFVPGFQSGPTRHRFEHMPPGFEVDDFIASWNEAA